MRRLMKRGSIRTPGLIVMVVLVCISVSFALRYEAGEMVLKMAPGHSIDEVTSSMSVAVDQQLPQLGVYLLNNIGTEDLEVLAAQLDALEAVEFCQPNFLVDPLQSVQSSLPVSDNQRQGDYDDQEAAVQLDLASTHNVATGSGVRIAVLDGGVNYAHPVLSPYTAMGGDYVDWDDDPFDEPGGVNSGHGTFVAGVSHLVAPEAEIVAHRVTDRQGFSNGYIVAEAILQAVEDGCKVINLSLVTMDEHPAIAEAVAYAAVRDVLVVAAAGNGHTDSAHYPASDPNVLAVAAVDTLNVLADFSSYGEHVDVCAPGTRIYSPYLDTGYAWWGGTSFAAPFVAAQASLLWQYQPSATRAEVLSAILSTATNIDYLNSDLTGQVGAGLINPLASVLAIRGGANTLRVPLDYATIGEAVDAALPGDTILVAPGEYTLNVEIDEKEIYLLSEAGAEQTIIRPGFSDEPIIYVRSSLVAGPPEIRGFTFTGVQNNVAIRVRRHGAIITDNIFVDNNDYETGSSTPSNDAPAVAVWHIGQRVSSVISRNAFLRNGGEACIRVGPTLDNGSALYTNNTFAYNNRAVIVDESFTSSELGYRNYVYGNIFSHNQVEAVGQPVSSAHVADWAFSELSYNLFWENAADWSNYFSFDEGSQVFADPLMANLAGGDVRLLPGSPAIDAGHPDEEYNDPDGSRNDIGALPYEPLSTPFAANYRLVDHATLTPELAWDYVDDAPTAQAQYQVQVGTDDNWDVVEIWDPGPISSSTHTLTYAGPALSSYVTYYFRLRLSDGIDWGGWHEMPVVPNVGTRIHVPSVIATIQQAVDVSVEGDTILIEPGTYYENLVVASKGIVIRSTDGPEVTIIEPAYVGEIVAVYEGGSNLELLGLTLRNGDMGVLTSSGVISEIRNCRFEGHRGVAIKASGSDSTTVVGCEIRDNGVAGYFTGACRFDSNLVVGNAATLSVYSNGVQLRNNIFARNTGHSALSVQSDAEGIVANNTFYGSAEDGMTLWRCSDLRFHNNLVLYNRGVGIVNSYGVADLDYNNVYGNRLGDYEGFDLVPNGLTVDPLLFDTTGIDFALMIGSPCIDAGHPDPQYNDSDGSRSDIGAVAGSPLAYPLAASLSYSPGRDYSISSSLTPEIVWDYLDDGGSPQDQFQIQVGTDLDWSVAEVWDPGPVSSSDTEALYTGPALEDRHTYSVRLRLHNGLQWGDWKNAWLRTATRAVIDVPAEFVTVGAAIDAAFDGDTIVLGPGTYQEHLNFGGRTLVLTSSDGPEQTILQGVSGNTAPVVLVDNLGSQTGAVIRDLTIQNGYNHGIAVDHASVTIEGCIVRYNRLKGIVVDNPVDPIVVRNNLVADNSRSYDHNGLSVGGGAPLIEGNRFIHNGYDGYGGAVRLSGCDGAVVRRNLFRDNRAKQGGAIKVYSCSHLYIHNNTFYGNETPLSASYDYNTVGGACLSASQYYPASGIDFRNNVVAENGPGYAVVTNTGGTRDWDYNNFYLNTEGDFINNGPGDGCIALDPLFVDPANGDFRLAEGSPCVDAGDPSIGFIDDDGTPGDMGAYPCVAPAVMPYAADISLGEEDPDRVLVTTPTFYWTFEDTMGTQQAYEIQINPFPVLWSDSVVWTSGVVNATEGTAVYSGPPLTPGTDYLVRVAVHNGTDWGSWRHAKFRLNGAPGVPRASVPSTTYPSSKYVPFVQCSTVSDGEGDPVLYDLQLAYDAAMTNIIASVEHSVEPRLVVGFEGEFGTTYYYRARSFDGDLYSDWGTFSFTVVIQGGLVELLSPTESVFPCGQEYTIRLGINNDQPFGLGALRQSFRVYSPDGGEFAPVEFGWINEVIDWDTIWLDWYPAPSVLSGPTEDTLVVFAMFDPVCPAELGAGTQAPAWYITTEVSCTDIGRQICVDQIEHTGDASTWDWWLMAEPNSDPFAFHTYPVWNGPYCFTIAECCEGVRGDVNQDGDECTIGDVSCLIDHLFISGREVECRQEGNMNGDLRNDLTISDISYGIDHLFISGAPLMSCQEFAAKTAPPEAVSNVIVWNDQKHDTTYLYVTTDVALRGVHLNLVGAAGGTPVPAEALDLDLVHGRFGDTLRIGLIDMDGPGTIEPGSRALLRIPGRYEVALAQVADPEHLTLNASLKTGNPNLPTVYTLKQNYPNPFNPVTAIEFGLPQKSPVHLTVYNILGQVVEQLVDREMDAGWHSIEWNADGYASGVYLYRLDAGKFVQSKKMILLK